MMARTSLRRTTPPPGSSTFCYWVKRWRAYQGVTQRQFSELWGVSLSLVQKIEADDYSVSQLSFERLETLRTLLGLPSSTFYGLIATHPDTPPEVTDSALVHIERLEPGLPPVSLPRTLLGDAAGAHGTHLCAFTVSPSDFADDRFFAKLAVGTLVVFDRSQKARENSVCITLFQRTRLNDRVLLNGRADASEVLRSFDPEAAVPELHPNDLEPLGVVVAYWVELT